MGWDKSFTEKMKNIITRLAVTLLAIMIGTGAFGLQHPMVMAASGADLTVEEITLSPGEPSLDEAVTVTARIKNLGDTEAAASYVTFYLDDAILKNEPIGGIQPGISATVSFIWTATGGSHVIKVIADASSVITETDENNNAGTFSFTTMAPDLIIQSITWQPETPSRGVPVTFTVTLQNQGNTSSSYTNMDFFIDGGARGVQDVAVIEPGHTITKTYLWTMLEGSHTVRAVVDINNGNKESNESNNDLVRTISTLPADLVVDQITWTPVNPSKDDIVTFSVTVRNAGAGHADQTYLGYYIDDIFQSMINVPALDGGSLCNITFTWKATLESKAIKVEADYYKMVNETNENNNILEMSLSAQPPDLIVSNVSWMPAEPNNGDPVTFTIYVKNTGSGRAESSKLVFTVDILFIKYLDVPAIEAGSEASVTVTYDAVSGEHEVNLQADYQQRVKESNEENNRYKTFFAVQPPDLVISRVTYTPEKPMLGDTVTFSVTLSNVGKGKSELFNVSYFIDDSAEGTDFVNSLNAGTSTELTWKWKIGNGHHIFKTVLDLDNSVMEGNEKNNASITEIAPNLADLAITNVTWSPAEIPVGKDTIFTIVVENLGGVTAEPSRLMYYIDGEVAGFNDISLVQSGSKTTQTFKWSAEEGQHTFTIVADSKDQVVEIEENNNTVSVKIPPPDLQVAGIAFSPQNAMSGDVVNITVSIINNRGNTTPGSLTECFIDGESLGKKTLEGLAGGKTGEITFHWIAESGAHEIKIVADVDKSVMEMDETNNEAAISFVTATPDLEVGNVTWMSEDMANNKQVTLTITINNNGGAASGPFSLQYAFDNAQTQVQVMASIPGGSSADFTVRPILSEGTHTLEIELDTDDEVSELDKTNNIKFIDFSTISPDLLVRTITWGPITANVGDNVTITARLENVGAIKAENIRVSMAIDGIQAGTVDVPEIADSSTASVDFLWQALEGEHKIEITADSLQSVLESNETNNVKSRAITFAKPEPPPKKTPALDLQSKANPGLLETYWWALVLVGVAMGLGIIYTAIQNMRKK